jgi:hypothetical protein
VEYISNEEVVNGKRIIPVRHSTPTTQTIHGRQGHTLFAVELPSSGGDTQFVNMHEAYDDLPEDTKRRIDGLKAVHVYLSKYSPRPLGKITDESRAKLPPPGIHPLVRTHPENGRKALYLNPVRIESIVGMEDKDALALVDELMRPRHPEEIRIPAQVAPWRLGAVGQPQPVAPGQSRLRHERDGATCTASCSRAKRRSDGLRRVSARSCRHPQATDVINNAGGSMGERIVTLGGGAVGGYVGGHLALHGHDVTVVDFWHDNVEAIARTVSSSPA